MEFIYDHQFVVSSIPGYAANFWVMLNHLAHLQNEAVVQDNLQGPSNFKVYVRSNHFHDTPSWSLTDNRFQQD